MSKTGKPKIELLDTSVLIIDSRYQRELDLPRVRKMASSFSWDLFGVLEASKRDANKYAIFDGQHRYETALLLEISPLPCLVHEDLSPQEEAKLFTSLQLKRKGLSQIDRFSAQVFAGISESVEIQEIINDLGLTIDKRRHLGTSISAVISLERIYRRWGPGHLKYTLQQSREIWGGMDGSLQGAFLDGFARFLAGYADRRYTDEIRERLSSHSPLGMMRRASAIRGGGSQMGHLIYAELRRIARIRGKPRDTKFYVPIGE